MLMTDPDLLCNKIGHEQQIIQGICTFQNCPYQRPCCMKCVISDHAAHVSSIKNLEDLKHQFSIKPNFEWLQSLRNRLFTVINEAEQMLITLFPVYPTDISLTKFAQFGQQLSQWNNIFYENIKENVENSIKPFEKNLKKIFNPIYKESQGLIEKKQNEAEDLRNQGKELRANGKYREAIEIYDQILQINPDDDDSFNNKGVSLTKIHKFDEALYNYDQALLINPNNFTYLRNKAACLNNLKRYREALEYANKAIEINQNYAPSWNSKGVALENLNQIEQALECYRIAVKIKPNDARLFNLADNLMKLGYKNEAINFSRQLLKTNPDFEKSSQLLQKLEEQYDFQ